MSEAHAKHSQHPRNSLLAIPLWNLRPSNQTDIPVFVTLISALENLGQDMKQLIPEMERGFQYIGHIRGYLRMLQETITREISTVTKAKTHLLAKSWTKLGGNRAELEGFERRLELLQRLNEYREQTLVHVGSTLRILRAISTNSANLRQRWVLQNWSAEPLLQVVMMQSLKTGLERLEKAQAHVRHEALNSEHDRDSSKTEFLLSSHGDGGR